jgi:hypothetical protein
LTDEGFESVSDEGVSMGKEVGVVGEGGGSEEVGDFGRAQAVPEELVLELGVLEGGERGDEALQRGEFVLKEGDGVSRGEGVVDGAA